MAANLNDTTPAAGAGRVNVLWQKDTLGNISGSVATGAGGLVSGGPLGTPSSGTLTNCTGLPESGVTGLTADLASKTTKYATSWSSQTSVTVTHNLGTKDVTVAVYDASDVLVTPESVTAASTNVVTLTFGASFTGRVVVIG